MTPFEKALTDAVLEEYADIPSGPPEIDCQHSQIAGTQIGHFAEGGDTAASSGGSARVSLWIDREKNRVYPYPHEGAARYFFPNQESRAVCLRLLTESGYLFQDSRKE